MSRRAEKHDFELHEILVRRFGKDDIKRREINPKTLRSQISVHRLIFLQSMSDAPVHDPARTGAAIITPADVVEARRGHVRVFCVDEQTSSDPSHALIAFALEPGPAPSDLDDQVLELRIRLAKALSRRCWVAPT